MSLGDEQELLINQTNSTNPSFNNAVVQIEESPSPEQLPIPKPGGLFAKLKSKSAYSRLAIMNESPPKMKFAQSEQIPSAHVHVSPMKKNKANTETKAADDKDEFVHAPESPSISHLHATYASKDDLDLHTRVNPTHSSHQPRASAVNPISIPLHQSQRQITLDTDFEIPIYKSRTTRSYSQGEYDKNLVSPAASPTPNKKKEKETFTKNIVVYESTSVANEEKMEEKKTRSMDNMHGSDEQIAMDIINNTDHEKKPVFTKAKSTDNAMNSFNNNEDMIANKRISVKDVFNVKKKSKEQNLKPTLPQVNETTDKKDKKRKTKQSKKESQLPKLPKGRELKKGKSVFDAFKKEKKIDLSNIKNLPMSLKTHLNDDSSDHAIQLILDHIRDLDDQKKDYIYEQLVKDKEFIPRICNTLLCATDAKHNEIVCIWLYDFFNEQNPNARLFALQFIPCLIWCVITRPPRCVSGVVAALLSLYKKECNIFDRLMYGLLEGNNDDISDLLKRDDNIQTSAQQYGVSNHHHIFPKFEMPDLDLPSIYHEPNNKSNNNNNNGIGSYKPTPTAPTQIFKSTAGGNVMRGKLIDVKNGKHNKILKHKEKKISERDIKEIRDVVFPGLNQANLSTNLHLIYVALQVFNHYITRVSKPSICLEQMCAVIAKLCSSGIDASQPIRFPDSITSHFAWEWKWYTDDMAKEKQHEKYIIPSQIMSQFLSSIRYSLKQPKTRNIAKFALGQVHKRGHIDMIPEIILQTTSMLHSAFMDGLTF